MPFSIFESNKGRVFIMKKFTTIFFAFALLLSATFISGSISSVTGGGDSFSAQAQTSVKRKRKVGFTRRVYRGGKWVGTQVWTGTKWVSKKTWQGMKWTGKTTYKTGRKVVSRTKKVVY